MSKNIIFPLCTALLFTAFVWYSNSQMKEMKSNLTSFRAEAMQASKRSPKNTTTILTEKTIERFRDGQPVNDTHTNEAVVPPKEFDPAESRRRADENAEHLQQTVYSEIVDPTWAPKAQAELKALDAKFPESKIRTMECRNTMCYIDVVHNNIEAYNLWEMQSPMNSESMFRKRLTIRFDGPNGELSNKIFLPREGYDLPALD